MKKTTEKQPKKEFFTAEILPEVHFHRGKKYKKGDRFTVTAEEKERLASKGNYFKFF